MDKSWITMRRNSPAYDQGVKNFIEFAFQHVSFNDMILCPCPSCGFCKHRTRAEVYDHLICKQFPKGYTIWYLHGEPHPQKTNYVSSSVKVASKTNVAAKDPIRDMVNDAFGVHKHHSKEGFHILNEGVRQSDEVTPNVNRTRNTTDEFYELSNDGQQPLYEGCVNYSKLSFISKLYDIKCLCGMSDKAMTMILELLHDAFPNIKIPSSFYDAKKTITKLGSSSNPGSKRDDSGGTEAEVDSLRIEVQRLAEQVQENERRFQQQIAYLTQQMANQNQNMTPNQENMGSPAIGRHSSQGSHSAHGKQKSDHTT